MQERRQNVRVRPAADYVVAIDVGSGLVKERISVVDVAVGGVALVVSEHFVTLGLGDEFRVGITLPGVLRFETVGTIRYTQGRVGGRYGVHFNHLTAEQQTALSRAVSELLERGHAV
jgi:hypothetical protein